MLQRFKSYLHKILDIQSDDKVLLTVSGGLDSVVMVDLFSRADYSIGIAHCNFNLRGEESDADERFVEALAEAYNVSYFGQSFDTNSYAIENKISTQMAARDLRYQWFEEVRDNYHFDYIATGHHKNDQVETFLINMFRGTGIAGIRGILPKQNNIIRPLLFLTRTELEKYVLNNKLKFREDSSNASDKYLRNKIRHQILPKLSEIDEDYLNVFNKNFDRFREAEILYNMQVEDFKKKHINSELNKDIKINIEGLINHTVKETILFEIIKEYGFNFQQAEDIIHSLSGISGKRFESASYDLLKDRDYLVLKEKNNEQDELKRISSTSDTITSPVKLSFSELEIDGDFKIIPDNKIGQFDLQKLNFPLTIRKWRHGDAFNPLGSKFRKKLSDYFIDNKFSVFEKENTYLLCSESNIIWIIGHQIDNRYKVRNETKSILKVELLK